MIFLDRIRPRVSPNRVRIYYYRIFSFWKALQLQDSTNQTFFSFPNFFINLVSCLISFNFEINYFFLFITIRNRDLSCIASPLNPVGSISSKVISIGFVFPSLLVIVFKIRL